MRDASSVRELVLDSGADLCGIASADSFKEAPAGFHPEDIWREAKSVAVFALRMPGNTEDAENPIPYTLLNGMMAEEADRVSLRVSRKLDRLGVKNVIIPSDDPYERWNPAEQRGEAILSMRHAGLLAGLGRIGKNGLLINDRLGSMMQLGAVLLAAEFTPDTAPAYDVCPEGCSICIDSCPVSALGGNSTVQKLCRPLSVSQNLKGFTVKLCWKCRSLCPSSRGLNNP